MILLFLVVLVIALVSFFGTSPAMPAQRPVHAFNAVVLVLAALVAVAVGSWLFSDAVAVKSGEAGMAAYLAIMGGGTAGLLAIVLGGVVRNYFVFPRHKRLPEAAAHAESR
jgi:hypothetical protein